MNRGFLILVVILTLLLSACIKSPTTTQALNTQTTQIYTPVTSSKIVAQKRIEKLHERVSFSNSVVGEINDEKYLFVGLNKAINNTDDLPGILIFNIQNPLNPIELSFLQSPAGIISIADLEFSNDLLYISAVHSIWIIDVSDPSSPISLAQIINEQLSNSLIFDKYLYINNDGNIVSGKITVVDISNKTDFQVIGSLDLSPAYSFSPFKIYGSYLYTFAQNGNDRSITLYIIDISSPNLMKVVGTFLCDSSNSNSTSNLIPSNNSLPRLTPLPEMASSRDYDIVVADKYAYIAVPGEGVWVLDVSTTASPRKIASFPKPETLRRDQLFISGNMLYLVSNSLCIIDISKPVVPIEKAFIPLPSYFALTKSGNYMYYFVNNPAGIVVMDISLP